MGRKIACDNTDYTDGFRITREKDGAFVAVKGKITLKAASAEEIYSLIKKQKK
jgi:hypothetical protein